VRGICPDRFGSNSRKFPLHCQSVRAIARRLFFHVIFTSVTPDTFNKNAKTSCTPKGGIVRVARLMTAQLMVTACVLGIFPACGRGDENVISATPDSAATPQAAPVPTLCPPAPFLKKLGGRQRPLCQWLYDHYGCCWTHHDDLGCSSLHAEHTFIFGSCREFYGEQCLKKRDYKSAVRNQETPYP